MAVWSKNKVESSAINSGNEYEKKDRLSREQLNAIVNNSFYASDTADEAKRIASNVEAGSTQSVSYAPQVLLEGQKTQARENIGATSRVKSAVANNLAMLDSNGDLADSGIAKDSVITDEDVDTWHKSFLQLASTATTSQTTVDLATYLPDVESGYEYEVLIGLYLGTTNTSCYPRLYTDVIGSSSDIISLGVVTSGGTQSRVITTLPVKRYLYHWASAMPDTYNLFVWGYRRIK